LIASTPVRFTLVAPGARSVALVGAFDGWTPQGRPMRRALDGRTWEIELPLPPGRHAFAFMVDGALRVDPAAARAVEDDFGVPTSVIVVANRGT
jgi:1,4-alpha-glucan branching enzyme